MFDNDWVDAAPFRTHLQHLLGVSRLPWRVLAVAADVPDRMVQRLLFESHRSLRRIRHIDARHLMELTPQRLTQMDRSAVPAALARRQSLALLAAGADRLEVATFLGCTPQALRHLTDGRTRWCSAMLTARAEAAARAHGVQDWAPINVPGEPPLAA